MAEQRQSSLWLQQLFERNEVTLQAVAPVIRASRLKRSQDHNAITFNIRNGYVIRSE